MLPHTHQAWLPSALTELDTTRVCCHTLTKPDCLAPLQELNNTSHKTHTRLGPMSILSCFGLRGFCVFSYSWKRTFWGKVSQGQGVNISFWKSPGPLSMKCRKWSKSSQGFWRLAVLKNLFCLHWKQTWHARGKSGVVFQTGKVWEWRLRFTQRTVTAKSWFCTKWGEGRPGTQQTVKKIFQRKVWNRHFWQKRRNKLKDFSFTAKPFFQMQENLCVKIHFQNCAPGLTCVYILRFVSLACCPSCTTSCKNKWTNHLWFKLISLKSVNIVAFYQLANHFAIFGKFLSCNYQLFPNLSSLRCFVAWPEGWKTVGVEGG